MKKNRFFLYEVINKFPGLTPLDLNERTGLTIKKIKKCIIKLYSEGMIKIKIYPIPMKDFINWNKMSNFSKNKHNIK